MQSTQAPSNDALQRLIDGVQTLVREHVALARAEAVEYGRSMGREVAIAAAGIPVLLAGYLLLMIALGYLLALWLPPWAAFGIVALANLGGGGALMSAGVRKLKAKHAGLQRTGEELHRDKAWLASLAQAQRTAGDGHLQPARLPEA